MGNTNSSIETTNHTNNLQVKRNNINTNRNNINTNRNNNINSKLREQELFYNKKLQEQKLMYEKKMKEQQLQNNYQNNHQNNHQNNDYYNNINNNDNSQLSENLELQDTNNINSIKKLDLNDRFLQDIDIHNINKKVDKYNDDEEQIAQKFFQQQEKLKKFFLKKQEERKNKFHNELSRFEGKYNPIKVLCLKNDEPTVDEIKKNYKLLCKKYHPDKGGDESKFKLITQAYVYLMNKYEKINYRAQTSEELQQNISEFVNDQKKYQSRFLDKDNFDVQRFNKIFDEYKIDEDDNEGYGNMMSKDSRMNEPDIIPIKKEDMFFNNKFNKDLFNKIFQENKESDNNNDKLIIYEEPAAIMSNMGINCKLLGGGKVDDFSDKNYTDYKMAHTVHTKLIDPNKIKYKEYKNIDELKKERSNINYKMSEEDELKMLKKQQYEQQKEKERLKRLEEQDYKTKIQFNQLNRMMIGN